MPEQGYAPILYGRVVDMFYFPIINGHFPAWFPLWGGQEFVFFRPVFNIADASISISVMLMILFQKRIFKADEPKADVVNEMEGDSPDPQSESN